MTIPFHMRYGSMICSKRLQSDRPHKCLNEMPLVLYSSNYYRAPCWHWHPLGWPNCHLCHVVTVSSHSYIWSRISCHFKESVTVNVEPCTRFRVPYTRKLRYSSNFQAGYSVIHLRLPDGFDEARVGQVQRRGEVGVRQSRVPPLLPQVSVSLVVLAKKSKFEW